MTVHKTGSHWTLFGAYLFIFTQTIKRLVQDKAFNITLAHNKKDQHLTTVHPDPVMNLGKFMLYK